MRDGDAWVINGRKVWSSNAQHADRVLILTRTTPWRIVRKKSKGMSLFFAPMDRSAITIKLIEKMGRHAVDSNELFIDLTCACRMPILVGPGRGRFLPYYRSV